MACHFLIDKSNKETDDKPKAITPFTDQTITPHLVPNQSITPVLGDSCRIGRYFIQYIVASLDSILTTYTYLFTLYSKSKIIYRWMLFVL